MIRFKFLHPKATEDHVGIIPMMLDGRNPAPAQQQLDEGYQHGGGYHPLPKWELLPDNSIKYPGDEPLPPLASIQLRHELILIYPSAWVAIIQPDRSFVVARMD